jgi:hypothetical protein
MSPIRRYGKDEKGWDLGYWLRRMSLIRRNYSGDFYCPTYFPIYLAQNGLRHCALAARKRSIFDILWGEVIDRVILNPFSAFGFTILINGIIFFPYPKIISTWCFLGKFAGSPRVHLLCPHFLVFFNIIHEDDVSRLQFDTNGSSEKTNYHWRLFEHAVYVGGHIPLEDGSYP